MKRTNQLVTAAALLVLPYGAAIAQQPTALISVKGFLRDLVTVEESFFSNNSRYSDSPSSLGVNVPAGMSLRVILGEGAWAATAKAADSPGYVCGIAVNRVNPVDAAAGDGVPKCALDRDSTPQAKPSTAERIFDAVLTGLANAAAQPRHVTLASDAAVQVKEASYIFYKFSVAGTCKVTAHLVGLAGGNQDFVALLTDEDNFVNWQTRHEAKVYWQTDKTAAVTMDTLTLAKGTYYLVVSNRFSFLTPKTVQVQADAMCSPAR